jgi:cysteine desulfuration protein SufE
VPFASFAVKIHERKKSLPPRAPPDTFADTRRRAMTLHEKQRRLIAALTVIPDAQERLAIAVERARRLPPPAPGERVDANRVPGCATPVWLAGEIRDGRLRLRADAGSPLVKGLVALLCELYDDTDPAEAAAVEPVLFEELRLMQNLSPTRRDGLAAVRARIRELAARVAGS